MHFQQEGIDEASRRLQSLTALLTTCWGWRLAGAAAWAGCVSPSWTWPRAPRLRPPWWWWPGPPGPPAPPGCPHCSCWCSPAAVGGDTYDNMTHSSTYVHYLCCVSISKHLCMKPTDSDSRWVKTNIGSKEWLCWWLFDCLTEQSMRNMRPLLIRLHWISINLDICVSRVPILVSSSVSNTQYSVCV